VPILLFLFASFAFAKDMFSGGGFLLLLLSAVTASYSYIAFRFSEFGVTNRRVLVKVGMIRRRSVELLLTKVEGIGVDQGVMGRLLDYGTIIITETGGTKEPFGKIAKPFEFRKRVQEQIAAAQAVK